MTKNFPKKIPKNAKPHIQEILRSPGRINAKKKVHSHLWHIKVKLLKDKEKKKNFRKQRKKGMFPSK